MAAILFTIQNHPRDISNNSNIKIERQYRTTSLLIFSSKICFIYMFEDKDEKMT
jgi:hypothetical protein